jgi:hypothetical protein
VEDHPRSGHVRHGHRRYRIHVIRSLG